MNWRWYIWWMRFDVRQRFGEHEIIGCDVQRNRQTQKWVKIDTTKEIPYCMLCVFFFRFFIHAKNQATPFQLFSTYKKKIPSIKCTLLWWESYARDGWIWYNGIFVVYCNRNINVLINNHAVGIYHFIVFGWKNVAFAGHQCEKFDSASRLWYYVEHCMRLNCVTNFPVPTTKLFSGGKIKRFTGLNFVLFFLRYFFISSF